jgi:LPXTG-motif cell wall-anchored protein
MRPQLLFFLLLWRASHAFGDAMPGCKVGQRLQLNPIPEGATNHSGGICVPAETSFPASFVLYGVMGITVLLGVALFLWIRKKENLKQ